MGAVAMKRTPLHRNKPLRSRSRLTRRKRLNPWKPRRSYVEPAPLAHPKPAGRKYDTPFMLEAKSLGCLLRDDPTHRCDGPAQFDHGPAHPLGRKADDDQGAVWCPGLHDQRQHAHGVFAGVGKFAMRMIMATAIAETRARVLARLGRAP